jgi:hypothetical protein
MSEAVFQRASSGVRAVLEDYAKRYPPSSHVTEDLYENFDGKYYKIEPADYYVARENPPTGWRLVHVAREGWFEWGTEIRWRRAYSEEEYNLMVSLDQEDMLGIKGYPDEYPDDYLNREKRCRADEFAHNLHRATGLWVKVSVLPGAGTSVSHLYGNLKRVETHGSRDLGSYIVG